jgi:hypothetical protein
VNSSAGASSHSSVLRRSLPPEQPAYDAFSLELTHSEVQTRDAKTLCFRVQEGKQLTAKPGQFLTFHLNIDGNRVVRCYSICSSRSILIMSKSPQNERKTATLPFFSMRGTGLRYRKRTFRTFYFDETVTAS